jgi:hypothetical protein
VATMRWWEDSGRRVPLLVSISFALFTAAWVVANPPSAAPDEADHYVKAVGAGGGDFRGRPPGRQYLGFTRREVARAEAAGDSSRANVYRWLARTTREFTIPASLAYPNFGCASGQPRRSWKCADRPHPPSRKPARPTATAGTYPPYVYVPTGLAMRSADDADSALRAGRAVNAALSVALLAAAAFMVWSPAAGLVSLMGMMVAVTPMTLFLASVVSASGLEVAASVCFAAALIRLARTSPPSRWVWLALAAGGCVLALCRPLGPFLVAFIALACAVLVGPRHFLGRFRGGVAPIAAVIVVAIACGAALAWALAYGRGVQQGLGDLLSEVPSSIKQQLTTVLRQSVGHFGPLDSPLPLPGYFAWLLALAAVIGAAVVVADRRSGLQLVFLAAAVLALMVVISALLRGAFAPQGRYFLPLLALVPLWAGELLTRLAMGLALVVPLVHALAWYANGRRVAVGSQGTWLFPFDSQWDPPGGWVPWVTLVAAATSIYLIASIVALRTGIQIDQKEPPLSAVS